MYVETQNLADFLISDKFSDLVMHVPFYFSPSIWSIPFISPHLLSTSSLLFITFPHCFRLSPLFFTLSNHFHFSPFFHHLHSSISLHYFPSMASCPSLSTLFCLSPYLLFYFSSHLNCLFHLLHFLPLPNIFSSQSSLYIFHPILKSPDLCSFPLFPFSVSLSSLFSFSSLLLSITFLLLVSCLLSISFFLLPFVFLP